MLIATFKCWQQLSSVDDNFQVPMEGKKFFNTTKRNKSNKHVQRQVIFWLITYITIFVVRQLRLRLAMHTYYPHTQHCKQAMWNDIWWLFNDALKFYSCGITSVCDVQNKSFLSFICFCFIPQVHYLKYAGLALVDMIME